jgi:hypothetical protein
MRDGSVKDSLHDIWPVASACREKNTPVESRGAESWGLVFIGFTTAKPDPNNSTAR